ncbi:MAG: acyl transferase [Bacteroidota bacterium]
MFETEKIFSITSEIQFELLALEIFRFQAEHTAIYRKYLELLKCNPGRITSTSQIPFLPVEFYKSHEISSENQESRSKMKTFSSSGTTGQEVSKHFVSDISVYEKSFRKGFELFYGSVRDYCIIALLPSYLEREGSALVYMMDALSKDSQNSQSGFYLHNQQELFETLAELKNQKQKTLLLGVTYALIDFVENHPINFPDLIVMETGGMKGKRGEMIRADVHDKLCNGFGISSVHSEYGMTELLSQAYSSGYGIFHTPPWMKIVIHQQHDLFSEAGEGQTGVISVIDLANIYSCSFITTQDVGRKHADGSFEVLGRTDFSDVRGCNLLIG